MQMHVASIASLLVLACLCLDSASAFPIFFADRFAETCTSHPNMKYGFHEPPQPNTEASFVLTDGTGEVVSTVCPGQDYVLTTSFPAANGVSYLLTTTIGTFDNNYMENCPNQVAEVSIRTDTNDNPLNIPAGAAGTAMIRMTWARDFQDFYHQMSTSFEVNCGGGGADDVTPYDAFPNDASAYDASP
eukprot:gene5283-18529_t